MNRHILIEEMTSAEYEKIITDAPAVLLPLGSIEVLGTHGPLGADYLISRDIAIMVGQQTGCLVAPSVAYGDTLELSDWPGTVCIPTNVLEEFYYAVAKSYLANGGAKAFIFLNFHSLNNYAANNVCRKLKYEGHKVFLIDWWKTVGQNGTDLIEDCENGFGHGGELITSVVLALKEDLVKIENATNEIPHKSYDYYKKYLMNSGSAFYAYGDFHDYCNSGAWGNISNATVEKGKELLKRAVVAIASFIKESTEYIS